MEIIRSVVGYSILCLSLLFFTCVILLSVYQRIPYVEDDTSNQYSFLRFDQTNNVSSSGVVSFPEILQENEFISRDDEEGVQYLISNFGSKRYHCSGICYCEDEEGIRRRSSSISVVRGVSYLLVAMSSLVAHNLAKDYFLEKCKEEMSDECSKMDSILLTEVEKCNELRRSRGFVRESDYEEGEVWWCQGNCLSVPFASSNVNRDYIRPHRLRYEELSVNFRCDKINLQRPVRVYGDERDLDVTRDFDDLEFRARVSFMRIFLQMFCIEMSTNKVKSRMNHRKSKSGVKYWNYDSNQVGTWQRALCVGMEGPLGVEDNQSVYCELMLDYSQQV